MNPTEFEALKADVARIKEILGIAPAQLAALEDEFQKAAAPKLYTPEELSAEVHLGTTALYMILNNKGYTGPEYVLKKLEVKGPGRSPGHGFLYTEKAREAILEEVQARLARRVLHLTKAQSDVLVAAIERGLTETAPLLLSPVDLAAEGVARGAGAMGKIVNYLIDKGVLVELDKHANGITGRGKYVVRGSTAVALHPSAPLLKESKRRTSAA